MNEKPSAQSAHATAPAHPVAWKAPLPADDAGGDDHLSQFFAPSTSVIAPELIRDLSLSPEALGFASGSSSLRAASATYSLPAVRQDRSAHHVSALSVLMVAGALLHSVAESVAGLPWRALLWGSAVPAASCRRWCSSRVVPRFWSTALSGYSR